MGVKVKEIYYRIQTEIGHDIELVAGKDGMSNVVSLFHVVEGPEITTFLEGQELIMTTGIALGDGPQELFDIVKLCLEKKASAMIINIGPHIKSVSPEVIQFANDNAFPLFICPWHVYMAHIMKIVSDEVAKSEARKIELISAFKNAICFPSQPELSIPQIERYDYDPEWNYCIAIIKIKKKESGQEADRETLRAMRKSIETALLFNAPESMTFRLQSELVICFAHRLESSIIQAMNLVLDHISLPYKKTYDLYIGIGRNTKSIRCLSKTYRIANKVAKLQETLEHSYEVLSYKDLSFTKLFLSMDDQEIAHEYYDHVLRPLVEYDEINHTDFVDFLEIYFLENCSVQETADHLFLHRNSINYKLKKIDDILQCDLNDFNTKVELAIALKLRYLF